MTGEEPQQRRVLIFGEAGSATLRQQLEESGYSVSVAGADVAAQAIGNVSPDVVIIVLAPGAVGIEDEGIALIRRLRADPSTYALPLVLVHSEHERILRHAALNIRVDDYFGTWTPHEQVLARLDALFWRIEVGRRNTYVTGDQRIEIDDFVLLLDSMREDAHAFVEGTIAIAYAVTGGAGERGANRQTIERALAAAHGFFKLNLRRVDAVGFYGPTTLLVYLPRRSGAEAFEVLTALREEFLDHRAETDIAIGLASFPEDGSEVESLIEKAEVAADIALEGKMEGRRVVSSRMLDGAPLEHEGHAIAPLVETATQSHAAPVTRQSSASPSSASSGHGAGADESSAPRSVLTRRLLLTVSDAARMVRLNALVRSAGYEARTAFDGQQALDLLRIERPDLLLLDFELKGIDGLEMLRRLRKQTGGQLTLPVVMLLPLANETARREALELGAARVIQTAYDPSELLDSVRMAGSFE